MINSSFSSKSAVEAIRDASSKSAAESNENQSFKERAMQEIEYFHDYVTGGVYRRSKLKKTVHRLTDKRKPVKTKPKDKTWKDLFKSQAQIDKENEEEARWQKDAYYDEYEADEFEDRDPRPKIYMAIFSTILFLGLLELYLIR